ncbi:MAG: hypothetical protein II670_10890 [Alphaproteobacteria bacterium]|nr:hypothetical protein [Alphaproteobacteria bacterium]
MEDNFKELRKYGAWMKAFEHTIVDFHETWFSMFDVDFYKNFKPFREGKTELEEGTIYLTIRCGFGGIYTCLNQWMGGRWGAECLDGSTTIAYRELREEEKYNG